MVTRKVPTDAINAWKKARKFASRLAWIELIYTSRLLETSDYATYYLVEFRHLSEKTSLTHKRFNSEYSLRVNIIYLLAKDGFIHCIIRRVDHFSGKHFLKYVYFKKLHLT